MNQRRSPASSRHALLPSPFLLLVAILIGTIALPGCRGCFGDATADAKKQEEEELAKKKKKLEKPKEDFEPLHVRMLPSRDPTPADKAPNLLVKPGHWSAVQETLKANNFDFPGDLVTYVEHQATQQPLEIENTTSRVSVWSPAVLPKGRFKRIESMIYVPRREPELGSVYSLRSELRATHGGRTEMFGTTLSPSLKDYEHFIVVLAASPVTPAGYTHFDRLHSVQMPWIEALDNEPLVYYRVIRPSVERDVPLPSYPLAWTTIAYIFWDGLDPSLLTNLQQEALLDWLHWGGQLVIDGPNSLDKLKGSFLAPYLPAEVVQTVKLEQAAFDELNARFSLRRDPNRAAFIGVRAEDANLRKITILPDREMLGVEWKPHADSRPIDGTGGLVIERRLGGGRIVATRFLLSDVRIKQWKNFDGFFNSVFLRRPARVFGQQDLAGLTVDWAEPLLKEMRLDARVGSMLRFFSRDIGSLPEEPRPRPRPKGGKRRDDAPPPGSGTGRTGRPGGPGGGYSGAPVYGSPGMRITPPPGFDEPNRPRVDTSQTMPDLDDWHFAGYQASLPSGVAAWNDSGAAADAARQSLTDAAGIQIPRAVFVIQVLAVYLFVLVPLNWLIFWLIGRVEWAWVAAPLIAVVGAGAVIRLAQLDIGFARSRTEIAILEIQGGYERAHLTRFSALYTSLSSSYTLTFDDPTSLALPFAAGPRDQSLLSIATYTDMQFRRDKATSLAGVQVSSNSTGMVHSEQMLPLGTSSKVKESLVLVGDSDKGYSVRNTTDITLRDVGVFRRLEIPSSGSQPARVLIETAYLAKIDPATSQPLRFSPLADAPQSAVEDQEHNSNPPPPKTTYPTIWLPEWNQASAFAPLDGTVESSDKGRVRLNRLARLAAEKLRLLPGDVRLIGWSSDSLPGLHINPDAPQNTTYTLVLAHLARGPLPPVQTDRNVAADYLDPSAESQPEVPDTTDPPETTPPP